MADVAEILVKGKADFKNANASIDSFSNKTDKAAKKADLFNMAMGKFSETVDFLNGEVKNLTNIVSQGFDKQTQSLEKFINATKRANKETKDFNKVQKQAAGATGLDTRGAAQANRFNSANFLAQFQDIAVTSAMGMNPLLIAVQQGTQLQYILAQSKAPLKDFVAGLKSMFSVAGMVAIGLTGVVAALIQMIDWSKVGKTVLNGLASAFTWLGDKLGFNFLSNLGLYFEELADKIGLASAALRNFDNYIDKVYLDIESKNFELSLEGLSLYEKEYKKAFRDLQLAITKEKTEAMAKGADESEISKIELRFLTLPEEAKKIAQARVETEKMAEAKKKEKEALENAARAAEADAAAVEKLAKAWDNLQTSAQNKITDLLTQQNLIGAGTYEKTYVETLNDYMRQAQNSGIDLYSKGADGRTAFEVLQENARATASLSEEVETLTDRFNFAKSTVKGFFTDMRHGLRDGQSAWEAFGNAVNNVLDKILDKMMDIGVDALFNAGRASGFLNFGTPTTGIGGLQVGQSSGNLTYLGNVAPAANGGVFTNNVYNSPTLFKFAKGGRFGVMGEAGPEAVMPLTRGPDGSLGVRADNANSSPVVVNVINNSNAQAKVEQRQTSQGMEIDVMIDQLVAEKMNQPGTSSNNALRAFNNQKLIAR